MSGSKASGFAAARFGWVCVALLGAGTMSVEAQCQNPRWIANEPNVQGLVDTHVEVWDPDGAGPGEEFVVVSGRIANLSSISQLGLWNGAWTFPSLGAGVALVETHAMFASGTTLYVAGRMTIGGVTGERIGSMTRDVATGAFVFTPIAEVSGTGVGAPLGAPARIRAISVIGSSLVIGGEFSGVTRAGQSTVSPASNFYDFVAPIFGGADGPVRSLLSAGLFGYVGGSFGNAGFGNSAGETPLRTSNIAIYTPGASPRWRPMADGVGGGVGGLEGVFAIAPSPSIEPNSIVVAGAFSTATPSVVANSIARWTSTSGAAGFWSGLGPLGTAPGANVLSVRDYNGRVFAGGTFQRLSPPIFTIMGQLNPAASTLGEWSALPQQNSPIGLGTSAQFVTDMAVFRGELIVVGVLQLSGGTGGQPVGMARYSATTLPWIQTHPLDLNRACNGSLQTTIASGYANAPNANILYQWRKNGVPVVGSARISGSTTPGLSFSAIWASDAGTYDCVVSAPCGSVVSRTARILVCPADFNCSGAASLQDIYDFLPLWFASSARADINADGVVGVQDVLTFLESWFAGCG